jgi:hypothetical protein
VKGPLPGCDGREKRVHESVNAAPVALDACLPSTRYPFFAGPHIDAVPSAMAAGKPIQLASAFGFRIFSAPYNCLQGQSGAGSERLPPGYKSTRIPPGGDWSLTAVNRELRFIMVQ